MIWQFKNKDHTAWHRWFAWHPVSLGNGKWAWLCFVQRRVEYNREGWTWFYSLPSYFS